MPVYEYQCENCSCRFELKRRFSDNSVVTCPECGRNTRRIFTPAPIIFKGSGFYVTDNPARGKRKLDNKRDGDRPADISKGTEAPKEEKGKAAS